MKCEKCKKIAEIVENMYDTIILEPLNEIDIHRYYIEKLCKIFRYNKHSLKILKEKYEQKNINNNNKPESLNFNLKQMGFLKPKHE